MEISPESVSLPVTNPKWIEKYFVLEGKHLKLYPYQEKFIEDQSDKRIVLKARQTGFSTVVALEALLRCINPDKTILVVSVAERQALEIINKVKKFLNIAERFAVGNTKIFDIERETKKEFLFKNGSRIVSLPNNPQAARGYTADYIYLDEFAWLENAEQMITAIEPSLSRGGKITYISTPAGKVGKFYDLWNEAEKLGISKHEVHWKMCPDETYQKKILEFKEKMDAFSFEQEYELQFLSEGLGFFSPVLVKPCIVDNLSEQVIDKKNLIQFGMDIGKVKSNSVLVIVEKAEIEKEEEKKIMIFVRKIQLWKLGTDYDLVKSDFKRYSESFKPSKSNIDATGVGERFAEELRKELGAVIVPQKFSIPMKERMFSELRNLFENKGIQIPNNPVLLTQLYQFERTITEGGTVRYKGKNDDIVMALALSCFELTRPRPVFKLRGV